MWTDHVQVPIIALPAFGRVVPPEHARAEYGADSLCCKGRGEGEEDEVRDRWEGGECERVGDGLDEGDPVCGWCERGRLDPRHPAQCTKTRSEKSESQSETNETKFTDSRPLLRGVVWEQDRV